MIRITVYGHAQPAGSKRGFPRKRSNGSTFVSIVDANPNAKDWKNAVASAAREAYSGDLLNGPLAVSMVFYRPRPKGHFTSSGGLSKSGRTTPYPTPKPDVLKLARAVEDALTGVVYRDDAQIVDEHIAKSWGEPARCEIEIVELFTPVVENQRATRLRRGPR